jgi:hypothetical protein
MPVDLLYANIACQLQVDVGPSISGQCRVMIQSSDTTTSGNFTDPTSGLSKMPGQFLSGGILVVNSGNVWASGGTQFSLFQRPGRYVRGIVMSGDQNNAPVTVKFLSNLKTTGSGGGASQSPANATFTVNV